MEGGSVVELETLMVRLVADPSEYLSGIENALTESIKEFAKFEDQMNRTAAVAGGIGKDQMEEMSRRAVDLSNAGLFAAADLAEGYYTLTTAGLSAAQSQEALGVAEQFATVAHLDLQKATELLINSQTALGLRSQDAVKNAENMRRVAEVLNEGAISTQASAEDFARAIKTKSGAAARVLGKDIEELMGMLKVMASAGVKAELAGEQAYIVMRDLQAASMKNRNAWQTMGVTVYDTAGEMRNLADIFKDLTNLTAGMSDEQRKATMKLLGFTDRSVAASFNLLGLGDAMAAAETESRAATDAMEEMAETIKKSLNSQLVILYNNFKNIGIVVGEYLAPYLREFNGYLKGIAKWWGSLNKESQQFIIIATLVTIAIVTITAAIVALTLATFTGVIALGLFIAAALLIAPELVVAAALAAVVVGGFLLLAAAVATAAGLIIYWLVGPEGIRIALKATLIGIGDFADKAIGYMANFSTNVVRFVTWIEKLKNANSDFQRNLILGMGPGLTHEMGEKAGKAFVKGYVSPFTDIRDILADLANHAATGKTGVSNMLERLDEDSIKARELVERLNEQLRRQVETHGMNAAQVTAWRIAQSEATEEQKAAASASAAYVTQLIEQEKQVKRAAMVMQREMKRTASEEERMVKRHQTPLQQFQNTVRELQEMLVKGLISTEAFVSEFGEAQEKLAKGIQVNGRVLGMDALLAGSSEAMQIALETKQQMAEGALYRRAMMGAMAGATVGAGVPGLVPMPGIAALRSPTPIDAPYGTSLREALYGDMGPVSERPTFDSSALGSDPEEWNRRMADYVQALEEYERKKAKRPEVVIEPADL